jgi:DDE superfamily endonuclease
MGRDHAGLEQRHRCGLVAAVPMEEGSLKDGVPAPFGQLIIVASPGEGDAVDSAQNRALLIQGEQLVLRKGIGEPSEEQVGDRILGHVRGPGAGHRPHGLDQVRSLSKGDDGSDHRSNLLPHDGASDPQLTPAGCAEGMRGELYSGKRHRSGAAVQILSGTDGHLRHVGEPIPGSIHDIKAFRETGLADVLAEHMDNNLVIADMGYCGEPVVTPVRKPPKGELSPAQVDANKHLSGIRSAVERCIAHLKNWKILATGYRRLRESSPSASQWSPHSNSTGSTGPVLSNAPSPAITATMRITIRAMRVEHLSLRPCGFCGGDAVSG